MSIERDFDDVVDGLFSLNISDASTDQQEKLDNGIQLLRRQSKRIQELESAIKAFIHDADRVVINSIVTTNHLDKLRNLVSNKND